MQLCHAQPLAHYRLFLLALLPAFIGCHSTTHDGTSARLVPADQIPTVIASASDKVQIMTLPAIETSLCFPQMPVWVRRVDGVVQVQDISLYDNRRLDSAYNRVAFIDNDRVGYCTPAGEVVIPPQFDAGEPFQEGIAVVQLNHKYGYIDQFGQWIVKPDFDFAYGFWFGLGAIKRQDLYGLVDHSGQWVKPPKFVYAAAVGGGIQVRSANGEEGFVDSRGEFIKSGELARFYHGPNASK